MTKVSCSDKSSVERVIDEFSVTAGNNALTYPIGLASYGEMNLLATNSRKTGNIYWLGSPSYFTYYRAFLRRVSAAGGGTGNVNSASGARPVVSLNTDVTISSGDGSVANPWVVSLG